MRRFQPHSIPLADFRFVCQAVEPPLPTTSVEAIEVYAVVHQVKGMEPELFRGAEWRQAGDFTKKAKYLCVNQAITRDNAVVFFLIADYQNSQTALQQAGCIGQRLYLYSKYMGLGCSDIGAYYDDETATWLGTTKDFLYVLAIGQK